MELFIHEIKLPESTEFSARFNKVSDAFAKWEQSIGTSDEDRLFNDYCSMKYCLEQGINFGTSIDDHLTSLITTI